MAEVYKVWDAQRMTILAMKVLREDLAIDKVFIRRFAREANTLAKLQHPNIVRFYGLEQEGRTAFMLLDYVEGETLKHVIFDAKGPLSKRRVVDMIKPILGALHFAHNQGMVHCDVKPGNIMFDENGKSLLADFGISRMTESATATMVGIGTPAYMAPEQVKGRDPTPQTDIYALGVVLYEMLTGGERPFTGEQAAITGSTNEKVRWEHLNLNPIPPTTYNPSLSPEMEEVVLKCLEKEPDKRYPSATELLNDLEKATNGKEIIDIDTEGITAPGVGTAEDAEVIEQLKGIAREREAEPVGEKFEAGVKTGSFRRSPPITSLSNVPTTWITVGAAAIVLVWMFASGLFGGTPDSSGDSIGGFEKPADVPAPTETPEPSKTPVLLPTPFGGGRGGIFFLSDLHDPEGGKMEIFSLAIESGEIIRITYAEKLIWTFSVSTQREQIVFEDYEDHQLYLWDMNESFLTRLTEDSSSYSSPHWSPDGEWVVFSSNLDGGDDEIYLLDTDVNEYIQLTSNNERDWWPIFTHDGQQIIYAREGGIWIMNIDGSDQRILYECEGVAYAFQLSPDGKDILFASNLHSPGDAAVEDLYIVSIDGRNLRQMTGTWIWPGATWSADGQYIVYAKGLFWSSPLYIMKADGSDIELLLDTAGGSFFPVWIP